MVNLEYGPIPKVLDISDLVLVGVTRSTQRGCGQHRCSYDRPSVTPTLIALARLRR